MAKTDNLTDFMLDLADSIRAKKGTTEPINPQDFRKEIESISGGGESGGGSNYTYYRYDRDNAMAVWGDASTELTLALYANMVGCLDIVGISTSGKLTAFAEAMYQVMQDAAQGSNRRIPLSYYATNPNTIMGKQNPDIAGLVTNMHDFIRLVGKEMLQWSEDQINAAVALFTEISEEEFFAAITK